MTSRCCVQVTTWCPQGVACESCQGRQILARLEFRPCYPGTGPRGTISDNRGLHFTGWLGTYRRCVDLFPGFPSQFVRDKFVEHGWDGGEVSKYCRIFPEDSRNLAEAHSEKTKNRPAFVFRQTVGRKRVSMICCGRCSRCRRCD